MMRLQITTQPAILGVRTQDATLKTPALTQNVLDMETTKPQVNMQTTLPKVTIDQSQCFNESGLKNQEAFMADNKSFSQQMASSGIARIVDQGNEMMAIESGADAVAEQAEYNAYTMFEHEFGLVTMPQSRPVIELQRGEVDIQFEPGEVRINNFGNYIEQGTYTPWNIEFFMEQYNSIKVEVVGGNFDMKI